jgi:hypothetical protein
VDARDEPGRIGRFRDVIFGLSSQPLLGSKDGMEQRVHLTEYIHAAT